MGGDGGVIATQRKYVRGAKDPDKDLNDRSNVKRNQRLRTRQCVQSGTALQEPIVCCELGNLYSKESVLTAFLDKSLNPKLLHIRGLKDVKTLKFCPNPNYTADKESEGDGMEMFICPITKVAFNGNQPFVVIWTTGFVLSRKAVKEMGVAELQSEYGPFDEEDLIPLIPLEEELDEQIAKMKVRRSKAKEAKKTSKEAKRHSTETGSDMNTEDKRKKKKIKNTETTAFAEDVAKPPSFSKTSLTMASTLCKDAAKRIESQSTSSSLYKGLFHKDQEKDFNARDLLMSVAGLRYTNGMQ